MNHKTEHTHIAGPVGAIQVAIDAAANGQACRGNAIIVHPHPQQGGTMDNKVVTTLAKTFNLCGYRTIRFNFRGVGSSAGEFDRGVGETQDLLAVVQAYAPAGQFALAGFSFGTYCMSHALEALRSAGRDVETDVLRVVLVGAACGKFALAPIADTLRARTLVVHGEEDAVVPLGSVMDWARPQTLPVTVVPAGSHFFHGLLPLLRNLVARHLA